MKNLCMLLLCATALMWGGCSKDDSKDDGKTTVDTASKILGTWEETNCESYKNGKIVKDHWSKWVSWTFKKDGSLIHHSKSFVDRGEYKLKDNSIICSYDWYGVDERVSLEILSLDEESLVWKEIYEDDEYDYQIYYLERTASEYDDEVE